MKRDDLTELLSDDFGRLDDKQLMSLTIYGEARGESRDGQIAVGSVILERVEHRAWDGDTIKEVCLMPYQFSCYLPSDPNYIALKISAKNFEAQLLHSRSLRLCYDIASGLIAGTIPRTQEIAEHHICQYVETSLRRKVDRQATSLIGPERGTVAKKRWWARMRLVCTIGRHEFYV